LPLLDAAANVTFGPVRARAGLVKDYRPVPKVRCQEARLGQVFLNLLLHAVQSLSFEEGRAPEVRVATWTCPDGRAAVEIADNGPGLTEDQVARVFEAFIADGLERVGLAISETLVREAGGEIEVFSRPDEGTRFRVLLPRAQPPVLVTPAAARGVVRFEEAPEVEAEPAS
jgi:signal transduction histidine kinase